MDSSNKEDAWIPIELAHKAVKTALKRLNVHPRSLGIDDPETLAHDLLIRLHKRRGEIVCVERATWVTAYRLIVDVLRKSTRRRTSSLDEPVVDRRSEGREDEFVQSEERAAIFDLAIEDMTSTERRVVEVALHLGGDLGASKEIADVLDVKPNAVSAHVSRIRKKVMPLKPRFDELESR